MTKHFSLRSQTGSILPPHLRYLQSSRTMCSGLIVTVGNGRTKPRWWPPHPQLLPHINPRCSSKAPSIYHTLTALSSSTIVNPSSTAWTNFPFFAISLVITPNGLLQLVRQIRTSSLVVQRILNAQRSVTSCVLAASTSRCWFLFHSWYTTIGPMDWLLGFPSTWEYSVCSYARWHLQYSEHREVRTSFVSSTRSTSQYSFTQFSK